VDASSPFRRALYHTFAQDTTDHSAKNGSLRAMLTRGFDVVMTITLEVNGGWG